MERIPNLQQQSVIDDLKNNIILFASAGTGKTFTVANRVANILRSGNATASEILCLTFTIKACKEMSEDIQKYVGKSAKEVSVNTIHSFCYRLLLEENKHSGKHYGELGVCDEVDEEDVLRSILSARYPYWQVEEEFKKQGLPMPNLNDCEVCMINNSDAIFFKTESHLIDLDGGIYPITNEMQFLPITHLCPSCGETQPLNGRRCANCGHEFFFRLSGCTFDVYHKHGSIRNLVSKLKHIQEEEGFYSEDKSADYQRAYNYVKENQQSTFENLISYSANYVGYTPDEEFSEAMDRFAGKLIVEYEEYLQASDLVDFDDLILKAKAYLGDEEVLSRWACRFKYIIVDEMQDTSCLEYRVLKKIFADNNVMLCGDFFQTIYGWRGSNPEEVLEGFIKEFSAKVYMFSENYRATKTLAAATFGYLKNTYPHWIGKYCPEQLSINSSTDGEKIVCKAFDNKTEEAWKIYKYLQARKEKDASKMCIIARTNKYISSLYNYFEQFNREEDEENRLRFFTVEENFNFFKKAVIKDILAVLRLLVNRFDRISLERLTEKYVSKVGTKTIEALRGYNHIGASILSFLDPQTHLYGDCYHRLIDGYQAENIVVYDTETTGLDLSKDEIVQISAIKLGREGEILATLDLMVLPTVEISEAAYETHGFNLAYIQQNGGLTPIEALQRFSEFVRGSVLVGHNNLAYDRQIVSRQLTENDLPPLDILAEYDTLAISKQFYPHLPNFKLSTLCGQFNVINECAHNALGDITATGKCLLAMLREKIIPTTAERISILMKHREKFEKIYAFFEEMHLRLQSGEELALHIIERLNLKKKYTAARDIQAMRDIIEYLRPHEGNMVETLKDFLKDAALSSSQMDVLIQKSNCIPIITVHQSKGCEFDTVILAGADDSNFPSYAAKQSGSEEEEKKVFYVAITRAKTKLILTYASQFYGHERNETPYLWMIPSEYVQR